MVFLTRVVIIGVVQKCMKARQYWKFNSFLAGRGDNLWIAWQGIKGRSRGVLELASSEHTIPQPDLIQRRTICDSCYLIDHLKDVCHNRAPS